MIFICNQAEAWIGDKKKYLEAEQDMSQIASLEDKMRKLQKHQAFQAELSAHESNIQNIKQVCVNLYIHCFGEVFKVQSY